MQQLDVQPTNPTPYTPVGGTYNNNPVPGAGGLPSLSGLSNRMNPLAAQLQSQGRGEDSVLVHMTPGEVNSLRGLAQKFGGDLSINPNTGLPEAGWLGKLLPTIIGIAGAAFGIPTWALAGGTAVGQTALTGDLSKGLMAGLGAWGGASLAGGLGIGKAGEKVAEEVAKQEAAKQVGAEAAKQATQQVGTEAVKSAGLEALGVPPPVDSALAGVPEAALPGSVLPGGNLAAMTGADVAGTNLAANAGQQVATKAPGFFDKYKIASKLGMPGGVIGKYAPYAAGLGTLSGISEATAPQMRKYKDEEDKWKYEGPYMPMPRRLRPSGGSEGEISFFEETNPYPGFLTASGGIPTGYADGGNVAGYDPSKIPAASEAARNEYLKAFDDRLKGVTLNDTDTAYIQKLRAGIADPLGAVDQQGNRVEMSDPQLRAAAESRLAQLDATIKNASAPPPPLPPSQRLTLTGLPMLDTTTKSTVTDTTTPKDTTVRDTTTTTTTTPGATQSGYGVETLPGTYTPRFTQKADYVTPAVKPYTGGSEALANLAAFTQQFQTSPGAVTASRTYTGMSPSQRIRAAAQANAANPAATGEINYGIPKPTVPTAMDGVGAIPGTADFWTQLAAQYGFNPNASALQYAAGGIHMDDGSFVVDARTVSELGNGSSSAGQELLARLGGHPVKGPGDGVSDSIPANIGGTQEARVARDEVIFPAAAVKKLGGAKKLYALMDKAHKARKGAKRGEDTKVAKGLGALA